MEQPPYPNWQVSRLVRSLSDIVVAIYQVRVRGNLLTTTRLPQALLPSVNVQISLIPLVSATNVQETLGLSCTADHRKPQLRLDTRIPVHSGRSGRRSIRSTIRHKQNMRLGAWSAHSCMMHWKLWSCGQNEEFGSVASCIVSWILKLSIIAIHNTDLLRRFPEAYRFDTSLVIQLDYLTCTTNNLHWAYRLILP